MSETLDEEVHLLPSYMDVWTAVNPHLTGRKHTFFYDERLEVARGAFTLDGVTREIGLVDINQDGRFYGVTHPENPSFSDVLIIDENGDGRLTMLHPVEL